MSKSNQLPADLSSLFWDYDTEELDVNVYKELVIGRVLEKGRTEHLVWVFDNYAASDIKSTVHINPNLSPNTRYFWKNFFNVRI